MTDHAAGAPDSTYVALGKFFAEFSQFQHQVEVSTAFVLAGGRSINLAFTVLVGREATAAVDGYFRLCAEIGSEHWSDDDRHVMRVLRRDVQSLIEARNRFAHDIWQIGWQSRTGDDEPVALPPEIQRIEATKTGVTWTTRPVTTSEMTDRTEQADRLRRILGSLMYTVIAHAAEQGAVAPVPIKVVGDPLPPGSAPSPSQALQVRDGQVEWTWPK